MTGSPPRDAPGTAPPSRSPAAPNASDHARAGRPRRRRILVKVLVGVTLVGGLAFMFMRSVRDTLAVPYNIRAETMRNWKLGVVPANGPSDAVLVLQPPQELSYDLFGQIFKRVMESMQTPANPAIPLVLKREFTAALAGRVTPEELLAAAREAGLDSAAFRPRCLAHRRISDPRANQQIYFVLFDAPAFVAFRERVAAMAGARGAVPEEPFEPTALSPLLFIAVSESTIGRWLPLRADAQADCIAPIAIDGAVQP